MAKTTDVSRSADVKELVAFTIGKFSRIDALCNVAGVSGNLGFVADDTEENFDLLVDVNLKSVFLGMKYAIPAMLSSGGGSIVNISSMAGLLGTPGLGSYSASKGGVIQLSRTAAIEYAAQGVRVNVICPGVIDTPILAKPRELFPDAETRLIAGTPMGRIGRPEEIAAAMLFLASSQSSYVTGAVLPVDGGMGAG
jgi:NAD(P)-dependent dehydrogenase (short-subunit alcohol dehydrogenase family)